MEIFENRELNVEVTTSVDGNGDILFRARDVATALGYRKPENAFSRHVRSRYKTRFSEIRGSPETGEPCGEQPGTVFIREPGVYTLIARSKLPAAEAFQDCVFSEVLPSIRKTGAYAVSDPIERVGSVTSTELAVHGRTEITAYKAILKTQLNMLKDPVKVELGRRGGLAAQDSRRGTETELINMRKKAFFEETFRDLFMMGVDFD